MSQSHRADQGTSAARVRGISASSSGCRNPTIQIRALPTINGGFDTRIQCSYQSQSHRADQGTSSTTCGTRSARWQPRRNPTVRIRALRADGYFKYKGTWYHLSQSTNTARGHFGPGGNLPDCERIHGVAIPPCRSGYFRQNQGFTHAQVHPRTVAIPPDALGHFGRRPTPRSTSRPSCRNPTLQTRALRAGRRGLPGWLASGLVAIPQYRSGHFGPWIPRGKPTEPIRGHKPTIQVRELRTPPVA